MIQHKTSDIIEEYTQLTGKTLSAKVADACRNLLTLCEHWENIGKQDAAQGRFDPPSLENISARSDSMEIIELLRQHYMEGYSSINSEGMK